MLTGPVVITVFPFLRVHLDVAGSVVASRTANNLRLQPENILVLADRVRRLLGAHRSNADSSQLLRGEEGGKTDHAI